MPQIVELLARFSYPAIFGLLLACGVGAPLSEEVILLGAGALVAKGLCQPIETIAVAYAGVLAGDLLLFTLARRIGGRALGHPRLRKVCPPARREVLAARFAKWGALAIFAARFVAGLRACTFFGAGLLGVPRRRFALADALAAAIWVPAVILLAKQVTPFLHGPVLGVLRTGALAAAGGAVVYLLARRLAARLGAIVAARRDLGDAER